MRHRVRGKKFGRKKGVRRAFLRQLMSQLILRERIETTEARARELRPRVEKLISFAKTNDLKTYRTLLSKLPERSAKKLTQELGQRYKERKGGYLRIIKAEKRRVKDNASMVILEFVK